MQPGAGHWIICCWIAVATGYAAPNDTIAFTQAREIIRAHNTGIQAVKADIRAAQEGVKQAGALPNPAGSLSLEKFGMNEIEATVGQRVELGGKRHLRIEAAAGELAAVKNTLMISALDLEVEMVRRFVPVAAITSKLLLLDSIIRNAEITREQIRRKVEAGATRKTDLIRAEMEIERIAIVQQAMARELSLARKRFAALGQAGDSALFLVAGTIAVDAALPPLDTLRNAVKNSPRIQALGMNASILATQRKQECAAATPDLELSAGYIKKLPEKVDAPLVGLSLELPIFNRNGAAQRRTAFQIEALRARRDNELRIADAEVQDAYGRLLDIVRKKNTLLTGVLPKAQSVYVMLKEYYDAGSADFLDLSVAQSELLRLRIDVLDIESEWAVVAADLIQTTSFPFTIVK
jgi:outer membrane protein, heavy metal efflux system